MQDKEFDNLFRSKLDNFEAEPTGQVWMGITEGLDGKRRYRALLPWLGIAASITILAAAGILFIPQKRAGDVKPSVKPVIAKAQTPVTVVERVKIQPVQPAATNTLTQPVNQVAQVKKVKQVNESGSNAKTNETAPANTVNNDATVKRDEQPIIAAVEPKQVQVTPVVPSAATPLIADQTLNEQPVATQTIATANVPVADKQDVAPAKPKRRVHGIGGFLNTVIAAVDKRKDKIIEFSNSDDDESSNITAVNLGVLKFKKEQAK